MLTDKCADKCCLQIKNHSISTEQTPLLFQSQQYPLRQLSSGSEGFNSFTYSHIRNLVEAVHAVQVLKSTDQKNSAKQRFLKVDEPNSKKEISFNKI